MRLGRTIAVLGIAGALLALPVPAGATGPQPKPNATNQPARTVTQRAAAKLHTDLTKNRVRAVQSRAIRDAESDDGTASASTEPRLLSTADDTPR